jgi:hypothetical protein
MSTSQCIEEAKKMIEEISSKYDKSAISLNDVEKLVVLDELIERLEKLPQEEKYKYKNLSNTFIQVPPLDGWRTT